MSEHNLEHNHPCTRVAKGQSCPPCDELAALNQETSEAESPLDTFDVMRSSIYTRMNHAHDPLTSKLPAEVISKIFTTFLPDNVAMYYGVHINRNSGARQTTPFLLGAVCVAWRAIVWSTPKLWSSISLDITGLDENHVDNVRGWLRRSGGCPLYIQIYLSYIPGPIGNSSIKDLRKEAFDLFTQCSERWFVLVLDVPLQYLPPLDFSHAVMLDTLMIQTGPWPVRSAELDLRMCPKLNKLCVDAGILRVANVSWSKLSHLTAVFGSINTCVETLSKASFLSKCILSIPFDFSKNDREYAILEHNHLLILWIMNWTPHIDTFLRMVQFPALQHLDVSSFRSESGYINFGAIADLLRRSHCALKGLVINVTNCEMENESCLVELLAQIPSLETLEVARDASLGLSRRLSTRTISAPSDSIDHLLSTLSTMATTLGTEPSQPFLPNLQALIITHMEFSLGCFIDFLLAHANQGSQNMRPLRSVSLEVRKGQYKSTDLDILQKLEHAMNDSRPNRVLFDFKIVTITIN